MTVRQNLGNQELMGRAPHRGNKKYSSQLEKPPTFNMFLEVSYREIMTKSQNLGNQQLMARAPHRALKLYSSQLENTTHFQHVLTTFQRVRLISEKS